MNHPREKYYDPNRKVGRIPIDGIRKVHTVVAMNSQHHEIARRLVLGQRNCDIAKDMGITPMMVSNVRNAPVVKEQMSFLSAKKDQITMRISEQIAEALPKCVKFLTETIDDPNVDNPLKSKNAFGLLAAGGYGPTKNVNIKGVHQILTAADIAEIRNEAEQIGINSGIIDISASDNA